MVAQVLRGDIPKALGEAFAATGRVAVDTETSGLDWRSDSLELCQLHSPQVGTVLLQRVRGNLPRNLISLLEHESVTKVFHYAPFDLRFLEATWGARAANVRCTKAAAKLLAPAGPATSFSLQAQLEQRLGVHLDKGPVRISNWGANELTAEQIAYAAADVSHLLPLLDAQLSELERLQRLPEFEATCAYMPVDAHLRVAGIPDLLAY